jgi:16S rRNA (cytidine1402-2'-O)-methyltransferase
MGDVALVSDAGTPALNDPGYELVRAALDAGHTVSPVPGPCAPVAALVASGLPTDAFVYLGYLPRQRPERRRLLETARDLPYTLIFLETPHRLLAALDDLQSVLGDRLMAAARELTKLHEEIFRGSTSAARLHFSSQELRGEVTLVVAGSKGEGEAWTDEQLQAAIQAALAAGQAPSQIAARLASQARRPRREIYRLVTSSIERKSDDTR